MGLPRLNSSRSCCWSNQFQPEINASTDLPQWRGQKGTKTLPLLISSWVLTPFLNTFPFKNGPSGWIRCPLEGPVLSPPLHLLPLRCSNVETHHTSQHRVGNKGLEQGRPPLRLQNSSRLDLLVLIRQPVPFEQEVACFKSLQSRRFEARRVSRPGEAFEATPRTQNVFKVRGSWGLETI